MKYEAQDVGNQWFNEGGSSTGRNIALPNGATVNINVSNGYYPVIIYDSTTSVGDDFSSKGTH